MGRAAECNMPLIKRNTFGMDPEVQKRKTKEKKKLLGWIHMDKTIVCSFIIIFLKNKNDLIQKLIDLK